MRKVMGLILAAVMVCGLFGCQAAVENPPEEQVQTAEQALATEQGQIFLYGERHANQAMLAKELALWENYYQENGMRDLFVELPYYTAQYLNLWMRADDDAILEQVSSDWAGTAADSPDTLDFYQQIKANCPETVYHGTDVGHQYFTTGERYLTYLADHGQEATEEYRLTEEAIAQGRAYYQKNDTAYRENTMVENFTREYDKLNGTSIMGIYGGAHIDVEAAAYGTDDVPTMAKQLTEHYAGLVQTEDLTNTPLKTATITIDGKDYEAGYFGLQDLSAYAIGYDHREFWRLENAYEDLKSLPTTGQALPQGNYPMKVTEGQVFVIDYTKPDGTVERKYYRDDGNEWQGKPTTEEFTVNS